MKTINASWLAVWLLLGAGPGLSTPAAASESAKEQGNKKVVLAFSRAMAEQNLSTAASFLADNMVEHNPNITGGKAGYMKYFGERWKAAPKPASATLANQPVVAVAEADSVVLVFRRPMPDPADPSRLYDSYWFDAYRVLKGKIVEHWDGATRRAPMVTTMPVPPGSPTAK